MRNPNRQKNVDTLYVLGAGASFGASLSAKPTAKTVAPLDKDFCGRLLDLNPIKPHWVRNSVEKIGKEWKGFGDLRNQGLEAAIISQVTQLRFFDAIHKRRRTSLTTAEYLDHLAHLVAYCLRKTKENRREPYRQLANKVFPASTAASDLENRVITFNYDSLFDTHLLNRFSPQKVYFDRLRDTRYGNDRPKGQWSDPLMLKLHGSVNWECPTDEFRAILDSASLGEDSYFLHPVWFRGSGAACPDDDSSPCLIPPLPDKPITKISLFSFLWTRAYEYLHQARQIVLCGYSLPPTDPLAYSLFGNFKNSNLERVIVVDPDPQILSKWRGLLDRKGVTAPRWEYCAGLEEFLERDYTS